MSEHKLRLSYLILAIIIFSCGFLVFTYQQLPNYFKKDLISYDECTNAVVTANLYRDYFPPRLRLNPLNDTYAGWKEGPEWQHIPPIFLYVPIPFMKLDREISIEVRRLSYVLVAYIQGIIFIIGIALLYREKRAILAATLSSWLWLLTPFVRQTLSANAFGYSDIVLSCSVVLAFLMVMGYMQNQFKSESNKRHWMYLTLLACLLPLMIKNLLGALPAAWLFVYILASPEEKADRWFKITTMFLISAAILAAYFGLNFIASPEAFRSGFLVSIEHFGDYEGWKRPWHYFITHYLPERYLSVLFWPFVALLVSSIWIWNKYKDVANERMTGYFLVYFLLNLAAVSLVTSKSANFILQGYLFLLFFVLYSTIFYTMEKIPALKFSKLMSWLYNARLGVASLAVVLLGVLLYMNITLLRAQRNQTYKYQTRNERFFQFGELCRDVLYSGSRELFILDTDTLRYNASNANEDPDFWFRYYILFNAGSEARRVEELREFAEDFNVAEEVRRKYKNVYWVATPKTIQRYYPDRSQEFTPLGGFQIMRVHPKNIGEFL